jgi:hypothetical protein
LEVAFSEPVILDNWRIRDVDSGDIRGTENNWNWQDGIIAKAYDENGDPVDIEAKIGSSGTGLMVDANGIVHTDPATYNGGDVAHGDGSTPNATNGHIVLTSNFKAIKKLVITHVAGPDVPCQTRSALAMAGLAVCKPLKISGNVYDDGDGVAPTGTCATSDNIVDGNPVNGVDGTPLNACLLDNSNVVADTKVVAADGTYLFNNAIHPNTAYKVLLTTNDCTVGAAAPSAVLAPKWHYEGEQIDPANNPGHDGTPDGIIAVNVTDSDIENIDFAINKVPEANDYTEQVRSNPNGTTQVPFSPNANGTYISDLEDATPTNIKITGISGGVLYNNGTQINVGDTVPGSDLANLSIDPDDGDISSVFNYVAVDKACRESNVALFKAPFVNTGNWSGNVTEDIDNDDAGDQPIENVTIELYTDPNCDGDRSDGDVYSSAETDADGNYYFSGVPAGCYVAVETQPSGYLDVTEKEGGEDSDEKGTTPTNEISGEITPGEDDSGNDFVEEKPGRLCGNVSEDTNNDDNGDSPIADVTLTLFDVTGNQIGTTTTDSSGNYCFNDLAAGDYTVKETQPAGYLDVKEDEGGSDDDKADNNELNTIAATVDAGETDGGNDFVEKPTASIGNLFWIDENANGVVDNDERGYNGVVVQLFDDQGNILNTQTTRNGPDGKPGYYLFDNLIPGQNYQVHFDYSNVPELEGYVYSPTVGGNDKNNANEQGFTISVTPKAGESILTLDAGVNCGCSATSSDSGDALSVSGILVMMFMTLFTGLFFVRKEEQA